MAGLLLVATLGDSLLHFREKQSVAEPRQVLTMVPPRGIVLPAVGNQTVPEISPDGSAVLERRLLRQLGSLDMEPLKGTEGISNEGFWSADSKSIVFPEVRILKKMRVPDGAPELIAKIPSFLNGGTWSDTGTILISSNNALYTLTNDAGDARQIEVAGLSERRYRWPHFLSGEDFLFAALPLGSDDLEVYLATLRNGKAADPVLLFKNARRLDILRRWWTHSVCPK